MNAGKSMRRLAALGILSAAGFAVVPGQARADDGPIVDISLPLTVCGVQVGLLGNASGDCPDTPPQAPAIDVNLEPVTSGEILAPVTGLLENPEALLDPNTIGDVTNGGNPVANLDVPVLVCGNAVAVLSDASGTCPDTPPASPDQDSTINGNVQVDVCGNGVGVLSPGEGDCGGTSGSSGNDVGLPLGLSDAVPVDSIVDTLGGSVGPGSVVDVQQLVDDLALGELLALNVATDICGNGAAAAEDASAACPAAAPGTTPGGTTPGATTPGAGAPGATTPGSPTTAPGSATTDGGDLPGTGDDVNSGAGTGSGGNGSSANGGGGLLPTTGGAAVSLLGLGSLLAAAGIIARRSSRARRTVAA